MWDNGREKGFDPGVCRCVWSQRSQKERGGGCKATAERQRSASRQEVPYQEGRTPSLETDVAPRYCDSTSHPRARRPCTWTSQPHPPSSSSRHTPSFSSSTIEGIRRQSSQRQGRVFCCLGNFLQAARGTFHKKQVTWSLFSSLSWSHHLKHTRQIFSLLSFSLSTFSFFLSFSFSHFLKGNLRLACWDGKIEVSLLVALKILPNDTLFS